MKISAVILSGVVVAAGACGGGGASDPVDGGRDGEGQVDGGGMGGVDAGPFDPDAAVIGTGFCPEDPDGFQRPSEWSVATHCKGVEPDYAELFDDSSVQRIDITIASAQYQAMQDDLDDLLGGGGSMPPPPGNSDRDPIWVPVTVQRDGHVWTEVGMRFKGNSSLSFAYRQGISKLAFRLTFDKYEAEHPELADQRFYGFKKMTFSNGFKDSSLIRDKVAAELFREAGIPAARGAFARVYVDYGDGPIYFGLYTMIEDPSNKLLDTQFADGTGNLYKPDGTSANWTSFSEQSFEKKTNEALADWSDVQAAIAALHNSRADAAAWRAGLEATFNVDSYLRHLALNQAMVNWDSYGRIAHNYYLYGDPADNGRLVWIPWDLNEALLILDHSGPGGSTGESVMLEELGDQWPLIRYLLDDPVYRAQYEGELAEMLAGPFAEASVMAKINAYHSLIAPYVVGADGESAPYTFLQSASDFEQSVTTGPSALEPHVHARHLEVTAALQ